VCVCVCEYPTLDDVFELIADVQLVGVEHQKNQVTALGEPLAHLQVVVCVYVCVCVVCVRCV